MKKAILFTTFFGLSISSSFADQYHNTGYPARDRCHSNSLAHQIDTKESLLKRIQSAPTQYDEKSNIIGINIAVEKSTCAIMLGKVEYDKGTVSLDRDSEMGIQRMLSQFGGERRPNTLFLVLGYADRSGNEDKNYVLSHARANEVRKFIDHASKLNNQGFYTATIAMGQNVELCKGNSNQNRVAEIWLVEFPRPVEEFFGAGYERRNRLSLRRKFFRQSVQEIETTLHHPVGVTQLPQPVNPYLQ